MMVWYALIGFVVASGVVYVALSINGKTNAPQGGHGHGGDDHGGHGNH
jgi:hypothetical protein